MTDTQKGVAFGIAAYGLWGSFPLYWPLLEPGSAVEILGHRIVWSMLTMALVTWMLSKWAAVRRLTRNPRSRWLLGVSTLAITINWGVFIYGVNSGQVVETSLGYFINPLVTVLLGVLVLSERLRPLQWAALTLGLVAVVVLTIDYGRPPWIALVLAFSFATYGLAKKSAGAGAIEGLTVETMLIAPFALGFLFWLTADGSAAFGDNGLGHAALLATTGAVTAVPLLCFGAAATRIPMTSLGLLQYVTPILHLLIGVLVYDEAMPLPRLIGFALVWTALAVFTYDALTSRRRQLRHVASASVAA